MDAFQFRSPEQDAPAELYWTGGLRIPRVPHPPYDPVQSDIIL